jgi:hypothetical protein
MPIAEPPEPPSWLRRWFTSAFQSFSFCDNTNKNANLTAPRGRTWGNRIALRWLNCCNTEVDYLICSLGLCQWTRICVCLIRFSLSNSFFLCLCNFHFQNVHLLLFSTQNDNIFQILAGPTFSSHSGFGTDFLDIFHKTWGGCHPPPPPPTPLMCAPACDHSQWCVFFWKNLESHCTRG